MDTEIKPILTPEEERELMEGQQLYETTKTAGFEVMQRRFADLAFHSWVDPREAVSKEEWEWREINAFHASNNAREFLEWVQEKISRSEYLEKKKAGQIKITPMGIGRR